MDISQRQSTLDVSRHFRELAAIVESSNDAIIGKELDGTITSWNPAAERLYGYTWEEVVGRSVELLEPEDRRGEVKGLLRKLRDGGGVELFETVRLRKGGTRLPILLTIPSIR